MKQDRRAKGQGIFGGGVFWRIPADKLGNLKWRRGDSIIREGVSRITGTDRKEEKEI